VAAKKLLARQTLQGLLVSYRTLGRAESRAQYVHFDTVWDNLLSVHKYLKRSSDPLFIPWSRARRGTPRPTPEEIGAEVVHHV